MEPEEVTLDSNEPKNEDSTVSRDPGTTPRSHPTDATTQGDPADHSPDINPSGHTQQAQAISATLEKELVAEETHSPADRPAESKRQGETDEEHAPPEGPDPTTKDTPLQLDETVSRSDDDRGRGAQAAENHKEPQTSVSASATAPNAEHKAVVAPSVFSPLATSISRKVSFGNVLVTSVKTTTTDSSKLENTNSSDHINNTTATPVAPAPQEAQSQTPSAVDTTELLRAPLTDTYAPFIHPSDTCLDDARQRLRTALEQTRQLRSIFSQRVYEKYRILLRPVPKSTDSIVNPIVADPLAAGRKLAAEIRELKQEKAAEKKEAQKLAAAKPMVGPDGAPLPNAALGNGETMEQLAYIGAGLSFVVLPEEDIDESQINIKGFDTRGPTDVESGQRPAGISAAAAAAADVIIDRARRSTALRVERRRRREQQIMAGEAPEEEMDSSALLASLQVLTASSARMEPTRPAPAKAVKRGATKAKASFKMPSGTGKQNRVRSGSSLSGSSLLSLIPAAEELPSVGRRSAATAALMARGVGVTSTRSLQQRWRHPHPESAGGRKSLLPSSVSGTPGGAPASLPAAPFGKQLRDVKKVSVLASSKTCSKPAVEALRSVLRHFTSVADDAVHAEESPKNDAAAIGSEVPEQSGVSGLSEGSKNTSLPHESNVKPQVSNDTENPIRVAEPINERNNWRCASEIGLLYHLRQKSDTSRTGSMAASSASTGSDKDRMSDECESVTKGKIVDPVLALGVLQALGVVHHGEPMGGTAKDDRYQRSAQIDADQFGRSPDGSECATQLNNLVDRLNKDSRSFSDTAVTFDGTDSVLQGFETPEHAGQCDRAGKSVEPEAMRRSSEARDLGSEEIVSLDRSKAPVLAIRGGGEVPVDYSDSETIKGDAATASARISDTTGNQVRHPDLMDRMDHLEKDGTTRASSPPPLPTESSLSNASNHGHAPSYSPPRSVRGHSRTPTSIARSGRDRVHHQSHPLDLHTGTASQHHLTQGHHPGGNLTQLVGLQHSGMGQGNEWPAGISTAGLLQSPQSLGTIDLSSQRAALMSMSVRDQAARAILLREQQSAAAAHALAAHRQASAMASLSPQEAAVLLRSQQLAPGAALYAQPPQTATAYKTPGSNDYVAPPMVLPSQTAATPTARVENSEIPDSESRPEGASAMSSIGPSSHNNHDQPDGSAQRDLSLRNIPPSSQGRKDFQADNQSNASQGTPSVEKSMETDTKTTADLSSAPDHSTITERAQGGGHSSMEAEVRSVSERVDTPQSREAVEQSTTPTPLTAGLQFVAPPIPPELSRNVARLILSSRFHDALTRSTGPRSSIVEYMSAVGAAVPIPKALVTNPLKERLNALALRNQGGSATPGIPRDTICSTILVWLWVQHKESFQQAFAKSGRIDVDPKCKWLIQTAVDTAIRAIAAKVAEAGTTSQGDPRAKNFGKTTPAESERGPSKIVLPDAQTASAVSLALMKVFHIDPEMDAILPAYDDLVEILDECRLCALRSRSRERALLANLLSRQGTVSEQFSQAYVSSVVRAGEALGHKRLSQLVKDRESAVNSTLMPYDCISDEEGGWEDPSRPESRLLSGPTGEQLVRQANARAMIQKSLKKLQDRNNLRGGTAIAGPYSDPPLSKSERSPSPTGGNSKSSGSRCLRRKSSFASSEASLAAGTGSAAATSVSLYNPNHYSSPLYWDGDELYNKPYGMFSRGLRRRSVSLGRMSFDEDDSNELPSKRRRIVRSSSFGVPWPSSEDELKVSSDGPPRSTNEISWGDVAMIFQPVALPEPNSASGKTQKEDRHSVVVPAGTTIIAPFCLRTDEIPASSDDDDVSQEDLRDESVLARHQAVLDGMKEKLEKVMAARQQSSGAVRARGRPPGR